MRILFFDTETTGGGSADRLVSLAVKERPTSPPLRQGYAGQVKLRGASGDGVIVNAIYKPPVPISYESMAVHHITEKMVAGRPAFKDAPEYTKLKGLFESPEVVAVAHNASFDAAMFAREGIVPAVLICTYKLARALDPGEVMERYQLQYLRYRLGLEVEAAAHDALGDVLVLEAVFERLFAKMREKQGDDAATLAEMIRISGEPMLFTTLRFGKHKGEKIADVLRGDRSYLEWLLKEKQKSPEGEEDWIYTLEHYLAAPQAARRT